MVAHAATEFPGIPVSSLCVLMDYLVHPATYGIFQTSALSRYWDNGAETSEKNELLRRAKDSKGRQILVCVVVQEGGTERSFLLLGDIPKKRKRNSDVRDFLSRTFGDSAHIIISICCWGSVSTNTREVRSFGKLI